MKWHIDIKNYNILFIVFFFLSLFFVTIGYSSMQTVLTISGDLVFNPNSVATVNGKYYSSVQEAIDDTEDNKLTNIVMLKDSSEQITIEKNKIINLNTSEYALSSNQTTITNNGTLYIYGNIYSEGSSINTEDNNTINNSGTLHISNSVITSTKGTSTYSANAIVSSGIAIYIEESIVSGDNTGIISNSATEVISVGSEENINDSTLITGENYSIIKEEGVFVFNSGIIKGTISPGYLGTPYLSDGYNIKQTQEDNYHVSTVVKTENYTITYEPGTLGTGSATSATKTQDIDLTLLGAIFTRTGYIQVGWSTTDGGSKVYDLNGIYTENNSITLYPVWSACYYTVGTNGDYQNISTALNAASPVCTFQLVSNDTTTTSNTISSDYTITLDLNGYSTTNTFIIGGNLIINDSSGDNSGSITKTLSTTSSETGSITINGGTITSSSGPTISHVSSGTLTINGGKVTNSSAPAINFMSSGVVTINGGDISVSSNVPAVNISSTGTLNVNNGNISAAYGIYNGSGTVNIKDGTVSGNTYAVSNNKGTISITGGTFSANTSALLLSGGTNTITGGTYTGATDGIKISAGTLTLGINDSSVSTTTPSITGTNQYGLNITSDDAIINFYDGIIKGSKGEYAAIYGTVDNIPTDYKILTTTANNIETAVVTEIPMLYLYNNGDACTSVTGGWLIGSLGKVNNGGEGSLASGYINIYNTATTGYSYPRRVNVVTSNKINTTGYNYLNIEWTSSPASTNNRLYFGLYSSKTASETAYTYGSYGTTSTANTKTIMKLSLANYQGSYNIGGFLWKPKDSANIYYGKIYRVWLSNE